MPAGRVLIAMVVCLLLWSFLFAPIMERAADAGPIGARRTAALAFLRPLAGLGDLLQVGRATEALERALGRDPEAAPGGVIDLEPPGFPLPRPPRGPADQPSPLPDPGEPIRKPRPGNELRVVVVGDSLAGGLAVGLEAMFDPRLVHVWNLGRISTGLAREDYFNWQAGMREIVGSYRPDLVVVMLGLNDNQAQQSPDEPAIPVGRWEWVVSYRERVAEFLKTATAGGARVVWVGVPIVQDREKWPFYQNVNDLYEKGTSSEPDSATYLDSWSLLEGGDGGYTAYVLNEHGDLQPMRGPDGVHLLPAGNNFLARAVIMRAEEVFKLSEDVRAFSP